ncbi:MAG: DUF4932 domain-containing protein [Rudaea sp.]
MIGTARNESRPRPGLWRPRVILFVTLALAALVLLVAFAVWGAEVSVRSEAVSLSSPTATGRFVSVQADERLFTLMAALNAAGYDDENNEEGMYPLRQEVRARLAARNIPTVARLRLYFQAHPSQYVAWILQRGEPPAFDRTIAGWFVEGMPAFAFFGLDGALRDFYREADIASLWRESEPGYEAEVARYQPLASGAVQQMLDYARLKQPPTGQIIVLPNLLDAYWRGYGPRVGSISYVVLGPSDEPNLSLIQHEALHPIINSSVQANAGVIRPAQAERLYAACKSRVSPSYGVWETILDESIIRAVSVRLLPASDRESFLERQKNQGFVLVPYLAGQLVKFEESDKALTEFVPALLSSLNDLDPEGL